MDSARSSAGSEQRTSNPQVAGSSPAERASDAAVRQQLRDVILIEADGHQAHALWLNEIAKRAGSLAPQLNNAAARARDRARHLHEILAASEPKAEAS